MKRAVSNASPLIALAKADLLHLLPQQFSVIILPQAVAEEILRGPEKDPMRRQLNELSWIKRVTLKPPLSPLAYWQLGRGESEVIEYARHQKNTIALLDDKDARRSASAMKIPVMGTLGIVARSALSGGTLSFDDMIRRLQDAGTYLDQGIISAVRRGLSRARS